MLHFWWPYLSIIFFSQKILDEKEKVKKRVAPRSYDEWSKLEKDIDKLDDETKSPVKTKDKANINTAPKVHELLEKEDKISKLWANSKYEFLFLWLLHGGRPYYIKTSPLVCSANQWSGFYMIGTSVMKKLIQCIVANTKDTCNQIGWEEYSIGRIVTWK